MKLKVWVGITAFTCLSHTSAFAEVPAETQSKIVELFSAKNCEGVRNSISAEEAFSLRPNIMAIVAYCEKPGVDSEALFKKAEEMDPVGDLILTLHAKYAWKKDPQSSDEIWQKVLKFARNPYLIDMANEYLAGVIHTDETISLDRTTWYGSFLFGGGIETNARPAELAYLPEESSPGLTYETHLKVQRWYPFGSISANYSLQANQYFTAGNYNLISHNFDIPFALHVGKNEDIAFRPVGGIETLGGQPYRNYVGIGILGTIYRPEYKMSFQGLFYSDHISIDAISGEDADNFEFDYTWEFYANDWIITTGFSINHAKANDTSNFASIQGTFVNDHTDPSINLNLQRHFGRISFGFFSEAKLRLDSNPSRYTIPATNAIVRNSRIDGEIILKPNFTLPIFPYVDLYGWYEWHSVMSNVGPRDYIDRNSNDQVVGLALKTYLSSY